MKIEKIEPLSPPEYQNGLEYKKKIRTTTKTIQEIKNTGYTPEEALKYFAQLLKDVAAAKNEAAEAKTQYYNTINTVTKATEEILSVTKTNRRLRSAIKYLHQQDYYDIIRKAEKGYYEHAEAMEELKKVQE